MGPCQAKGVEFMDESQMQRCALLAALENREKDLEQFRPDAMNDFSVLAPSDEIRKYLCERFASRPDLAAAEHTKAEASAKAKPKSPRPGLAAAEHAKAAASAEAKRNSSRSVASVKAKPNASTGKRASSPKVHARARSGRSPAAASSGRSPPPARSARSPSPERSAALAAPLEPEEYFSHLGTLDFRDIAEDRAVGALLGLALGDVMGAPLEFQTLTYNANELVGLGEPEHVWWYKLEEELVEGDKMSYNKFQVRPGQWTDDTSMAFCLADSLLVCRGLDCRDLRLRFMNWWHFGYNNAFARDAERRHGKGGKSCGLGGNIGESFEDFLKNKTEFTASGNKSTSGNGSIMRLAPVAIYFNGSLDIAMENAMRQSLTTHQGDEAAECARLLAHILVNAFWHPEHRAAERKHVLLTEGLATFTSPLYSVSRLAASCAEEPDHLTTVDLGRGQYRIQGCETLGVRVSKDPDSEHIADVDNSHVLEVREFDASRTQARIAAPYEGWVCAVNDIGAPQMLREGAILERNWNWRDPDFQYAPLRAEDDPWYIGGYAMDCFAMALHCVWTTNSFPAAVLKAANLGGDADTVAAVTGQIAGAIWGASAVPPAWRDRLECWDGGDTVLRAWLLFHQRYDGVVPEGYLRKTQRAPPEAYRRPEAPPHGSRRV